MRIERETNVGILTHNNIFTHWKETRIIAVILVGGMRHPRGSAGRRESPCPRISIPYLFTPLIPAPGFQVDVSGPSAILDHQIQRALGTTPPPPSRTPLGAPIFFCRGLAHVAVTPLLAHVPVGRAACSFRIGTPTSSDR